VQTPTLAFVADQEQKRNHFKPETFAVVNVQTALGKASLSQHYSADKAKAVAARLNQQPLTVTAVKVKHQHEQAPLPFDLNELQQVANQKFGYSPKQTLNYLQNLYEREKAVTYPRTDSRYLTSDLQPTMSDRLQAIRRYHDDVIKNPTLPKYVYNDAKVGDHYGLIPTEQAVDPAKLDRDELNIYRLIVGRFVDLFKPAYEAEQLTYTLVKDELTLTLKTISVTEPGFKNVAKNQADKLAVGDTIRGNASVDMKQTQPPALLNEASLLGKMEQFGLGTPATRADIIDKLQNSGAMAKQGRDLTVTPKGKQLLKLVNPRLVSPDLTAKWENSLKAIEAGQLSRATFIDEIKTETKTLVLEVKQSQATYEDHSLTGKLCPDCGQNLREKQTKQGVLLVCNNCGYKRYRDPKVTNHRCGQCHKKMVILTGAKGDYFKCLNCGNTEAMTQAKGNKKMNKREEQRLLKKYSQAEEPAESPLAAALKAAMKQD